MRGSLVVHDTVRYMGSMIPVVVACRNTACHIHSISVRYKFLVNTSKDVVGANAMEQCRLRT
jgi:hypothetical protein